MFALAKIVDSLSHPVSLFLIAVAVGAVLLFSRRTWKAGRAIVTAAVLVVLLLAVLPVDEWLVGAFENRFQVPNPEPERVDGIIVLGGSVNPALSAVRGRPSVKSAADRLTAMIALAHRHPEAKVVFTGGSGLLLVQQYKEADVVRALLADMGVDIPNMVYEANSRTTRENVVFSRDLVQPKPGETWLLVTSALHMPRSVGAFRALGWQVVPYPVDYLTPSEGRGLLGLRYNPQLGLSALGLAVHEILGLAWYRLRGWSDALLPGP